MFKSYAYSMQRNNEHSSSNGGFWSRLFALLFGRPSAA
jgi:hypothetical protein